MLKKAAVVMIIIMLLAASAGGALAGGSGEIILEDTLYGGLIGGLLGGAWYLIDEDDAADKIGAGIGIGIIGGFILGVTDASASVKIENGKVKYAMPQIHIFKKNSATVYSAHLLEMNF